MLAQTVLNLEIKLDQGGDKMAEQEDPELTSSHGHTKITTIYRATVDDNELKVSGKDFPKPKI